MKDGVAANNRRCYTPNMLRVPNQMAVLPTTCCLCCCQPSSGAGRLV